jgi:hypothetical protein
MPRFLKNPFAVLLAMWTIAGCHATASEGSPRSSIRYVLTQPDGGEDTFWTWPNHNDGAWKQAASFQEVSAAIRSARATQAWIRIDTNLAAESINNSYFRIRHSGPMGIYVNGLKRITAKSASPGFKDYPSGRRRPESTGRNLYAIHFQHTDGAEPVLDIEWHSEPWFILWPTASIRTCSRMTTARSICSSTAARSRNSRRT